MKRNKHRGTIRNLNNDTIEVEVFVPSKIGNPNKTTGAFFEPASVKIYRQSSKNRKGFLGIKYKPSYYIGNGQITKKKDSNIFLLKQAHTTNPILKTGDKVVFEINKPKNVESN